MWSRPVKQLLIYGILEAEVDGRSMFAQRDAQRVWGWSGLCGLYWGFLPGSRQLMVPVIIIINYPEKKNQIDMFHLEPL